MPYIKRLGWVGMALAAVFVLGCANSTVTPSDCDPTVSTCSCDNVNTCPGGWSCESGTCVEDSGDASTPDGAGSDADAGPAVDISTVDAGPLKKFGEACNDKKECESKLCIFAGTGGICSKICPGGSCPKGFGCFGMKDVIEQGKVTDVCVPDSNMICTKCSTDKECNLSGGDLCLKYDVGEFFCGRDCSKVNCPQGYACQTVTVSGSTYKQCIPANGACDCDASLTGKTKTCPLTTPFGTCQGVRKCLGATGWGNCEAPTAVDVPDAAYKDDNCDGIDGDIKGGIFVATSGSDTSACGVDHKTPCKTVGQGLVRAKADNKSYVYLQAGQYDEVVTLEDGISLIGGYDTGWKRDARTKTAHKVTIAGGFHPPSEQYVTIVANKITTATTVVDLVMKGADAQGASPQGTRSSHVIHTDTVNNLTFERISIIAGNGASGTSGAPGASASIPSTTSLMYGKTGGPGDESFKACDTTSAGGGGMAGLNSCSGGLNTAGGGGGKGGPRDTSCSCFLGVCVCNNCTAPNGKPGYNAGQYTYNSYGYRGSGGSGGKTCGAGYDGKNGRVQNGNGGSGGGGGFLSGSFWYSSSGTPGQVGHNGGGGGGGGGAGGCDVGTDSSGAGGGGGGGGGCSAKGGGSGGKGGGGSFGVLATFSFVTFKDCDVQLGNGGSGGSGGTGGRGQSGGPGGSGGKGGSGASDGGDGGKGGHGGHGGGGGGGAGGVSYGMYSYKSAITQNCTFSGGSAGTGGQGGPSAPTAPVAERDGKSGSKGANASPIANTGTCAVTSSCN